MDSRLSRSMPVLWHSALTHSPRWSRPRHRARHFYINGVRTSLIGADSYPNASRSPRRLILCGAGPRGESLSKMTTTSSTAELSRCGVFRSMEDLRHLHPPARRATSCEVVHRATPSTAGWDRDRDSRLSESGVSLNDSRTDLGSYGDMDGVSQCSFGSSSAFHEMTYDSVSELDRPDSDCLSVCGHLPRPEVVSQDGELHLSPMEGSRRDGVSTKYHHGSKEKCPSELNTSSGRSSPSEDRREFYHSTPTKRGSPVLSIFPGDEEDLHFPSNISRDSLHDSLTHSSKDSLLYSFNHTPTHSHHEVSGEALAESLPTSPRTTRDGNLEDTGQAPGPTETLRDAVRRSRQEFFSASPDCSPLNERGTEESVQSWLTTGHTQRLEVSTDPLQLTTQQTSSYPPQQQQQPHHQSPPVSPDSTRVKVREMVKALEQASQTQTSFSASPDEHTGRDSRPQMRHCAEGDRPSAVARPAAEEGRERSVSSPPADSKMSPLGTNTLAPSHGDECDCLSVDVKPLSFASPPVQASTQSGRVESSREKTIGQDSSADSGSVRDIDGSWSSSTGDGKQRSDQLWLPTSDCSFSVSHVDRTMRDDDGSDEDVDNERDADTERKDSTATQFTCQSQPPFDGDRKTDELGIQHTCFDRVTTQQTCVDSSASTLLSSSSERALTQRPENEDRQGETHTDHRSTSHDNHTSLSGLQCQLDLENAEGETFNTDSQSPHLTKVYNDRAEASGPHVETEDHSGSRAQHTGTVSVTQDSLEEGQTLPPGAAVTSGVGDRGTTADWRTEHVPDPASLAARDMSTLHHARLIEILPPSAGSEEMSSGDEWQKEADHDGRFSPPGPNINTDLSAPPQASSSLLSVCGDERRASASTPDTHSDLHHNYRDQRNASAVDIPVDDNETISSPHAVNSDPRDQSSADDPSLYHSMDMISHYFQSLHLPPSSPQDVTQDVDDENENGNDDASFIGGESRQHAYDSQATSVTAISSSDVEMRSHDQHRRVDTVSSSDPLYDQSQALTSLKDSSRACHSVTDSHSHSESGLATSRRSPDCSPIHSGVHTRSEDPTSTSTPEKKAADRFTPSSAAQLSPLASLGGKTRSPASKTPRKSQWVQDKVLLFKRLLHDFDSKTAQQKLLHGIMTLKTSRGDGGDGGDARSAPPWTEVCDDLYRSFTRDFLEARQNQLCPLLEDHLPVIRFKRFLRKKHNSKLRGHSTFRIRHRLERLLESPLAKDSAVMLLSERDWGRSTLTPLHHSSTPLSPTPPARLLSDVFTDQADVSRSFSDSAYSTLSDVSSRHVSDLDSTCQSLDSSRLSYSDVGSVTTECSHSEDRLMSHGDRLMSHRDRLMSHGDRLMSHGDRLMSHGDRLMSHGDVFGFGRLDDVSDEGIDEALLDRLRVGHTKACLPDKTVFVGP